MKLHISIAVASTIAVSATAFAIGRPAIGARSAGAALQRAPATPQTRSHSALRMASPEEFVKAEIASADVVVFSKTFCPFCRKTKKVFDAMEGVDVKYIELNEMDDGNEIQDALLELSGQRTVPNVFIKGKHIGGNDDTQRAKREGTLEEMLVA